MTRLSELVYRSIVGQVDAGAKEFDFQPMAEALGISAFLVADLDVDTQQILSAQSTMDADWLSH